jgi:hypothetical protein
VLAQIGLAAAVEGGGEFGVEPDRLVEVLDAAVGLTLGQIGKAADVEGNG